MIEVSITIKRDKGEAKTYQLNQIGKSKKGTFVTFSPLGENADLPAFFKGYVKVKRDAEDAEKVKKI